MRQLVARVASAVPANSSPPIPGGHPKALSRVANITPRYVSTTYSLKPYPLDNMQIRLALFALAALIAVNVPLASAKEPVATLPAITLTAGSQTIRAEVAATDETRQKGLMFREKMARNEGMLFVFPDIAYHAMWMRNTPLPLAVAFMDQAGKIVSIHEMQPRTETSHQAAGPARYALEMNSQWFAKNNVKAGDVIKGLEKAPKPQ